MSLAWPLVGRSDELELVERVLARPDAVGVVLAGAAGVGKTRLAGELLVRASSAGRATAWVQATRSAGAIPFGAFAHLLPAELGEDGPVNVLRVAGDAVASRSADGRLVLAVDDAHLLDDASAALVGHLALSGGCFVVVTVRSREPMADAIVNLWKDGPLERVEVQALSEDEVAELLHSVLRGPVDGATRRRLWEASRGNPLYLRELVTGGVDTDMLTAVRGVWRWSGPSLATPRLTELVESRLVGLSSAQRIVLEIVAHAEPLESAFLDRLTERADRGSLERQGLLETVTSDRRRSVGLHHPLYSEAIRAATPPSTVQVILHQLAELLAASGARRSGDLLRLATWRLHAGDADDGGLFVAAARRAITVQDFSLAERLATAAVAAGDTFDACLVLATATIGMGRRDDAELQLSVLQTRADSDEQRVMAALRRVENLYGLGRLDDAGDVVERAASTVAAGRWRDALLVAAASIQCFGGDAVTAVATVVPLLDRPQVGTEILVEAAPVAIWGQIVTGRCRAALAFCDRLMPVAEQLACGRQVLFSPGWLRASKCSAALVDGRLEEAERWAVGEYRQRTAETANELRGVHGFTLGWVQRVVGRPRSAAAVLVETVVVLRDIDLYRHFAACLGELAQCHALVGDVAAAEAAFAEAEVSRAPSFVVDYSLVELARAWVAYARGEVSLARQVAAGCAEQCGSYGQAVFEAFAWHDLARLGDPQAAVDRLGAIAADVDGELVPAFAAHAAALAAGDAGGLDRAATAFEQMGAVLYAAEAAAAAASAFRRQGRTGSALTASVRAHRLAERCEGARTPALEAVDASLPLTPRELEIAGLAVRGLSNREIAERLVVSVRTVDNHLHNAYTKLGITHRAELAAIVPLGARRDRLGGS